MKKKLLAMCAAIGSAVCAFADEGGSTVTSFISDDALITDLEAVKTSLSGWMDNFLPVLLGIVGVFFLVWLLRFAIRLIQRFASTAA